MCLSVCARAGEQDLDGVPVVARRDGDVISMSTEDLDNLRQHSQLSCVGVCFTARPGALCVCVCVSVCRRRRPRRRCVCFAWLPCDRLFRCSTLLLRATLLVFLRGKSHLTDSVADSIAMAVQIPFPRNAGAGRRWTTPWPTWRTTRNARCSRSPFSASSTLATVGTWAVARVAETGKTCE